MTPIEIRVLSRKKTARGEFIVWSDGKASRHFDGYDEWCSVEEAKNPMAKRFGRGEQPSLFAEVTP